MAEEKKIEAVKAAQKEAPKASATAPTATIPKAAAPKALIPAVVTPKAEAHSPKKSNVIVGDATPGQVVKVFKKVGIYGECYQVLVRVLEGKDRGSLLRRNVRGPVRENDLLMLKETERDVRAI